MKTMLMAMYSTAKLLKVVAGVNNYLQVFLTYQGGGERLAKVIILHTDFELD